MSCSIFNRRFERPGMTGSMFRLARSARMASASLALVSEQGVRRALGQDDQGIIRLAVCRLAAGQVEGEWSSKGVSQAVKLPGEPAP